jgi:hypothetical protein
VSRLRCCQVARTEAVTYALMKDCKVMCRGRVGAVWLSIFKPVEHDELPVMTWPTREGAQNAAEMQGAAVIPINQLGSRRAKV